MSAQDQIDLDPLLDQEAQRWIEVGYRIESRIPGQVVLVKGKPINHILHLLLSVFTLGIWLIGWLMVGMFGGQRRQVITIDRDGLVRVRKA